MSILANRIYYINSENRVSGTASDFQYALDIPEGEKIDTCCVLALTIPKSFYLIRAGVNTVTLLANGTSFIITMPPGNYTANNFITVFTNLLNALAIGTFQMSVSSITGKYTYNYTGNATGIAFQFIKPSLLGRQMGFDEVSFNHFADNTLVSANVLDFVGTNTLFLHSDMVEDSSSVLQELYSPNTVPFGAMVYNCQFPAMYSKKMQSKASSLFTFSLTDEHNLPVDLNGLDICITLLLYRKEDLTRLFKAIFLK